MSDRLIKCESWFMASILEHLHMDLGEVDQIDGTVTVLFPIPERRILEGMNRPFNEWVCGFIKRYDLAPILFKNWRNNDHALTS